MAIVSRIQFSVTSGECGGCHQVTQLVLTSKIQIFASIERRIYEDAAAKGNKDLQFGSSSRNSC